MELVEEKSGVSGKVVAAVILIILVAAGGLGGLFYYFRAGSSPSFKVPFHLGATQTTSASSQPGQPFAIFGGQSGPIYNIQVTKVVAVQGQYFGGQGNAFILDVAASYSGSGTWRVNPNNFEVVSGTSTVYTPSLDGVTGETTPLSPVVLANGQQAVGQLAFNLPQGQVPSQLEYLNQTFSINVHTQGVLPTTTYLCQSPSVQLFPSPGSAPGASAGYPLGWARQYYYSGDQLNFSISPFSGQYGSLTQPGTAVTAISTNSSGVVIASVNPPLPEAKVPGSAVFLDVTVSTPSYGCVTTLDLQLTVIQTPPALTLGNVSFPATGPGGHVTVSNSGSSTAVVSAFMIRYAGGSCGFGYGGSGLTISPHSAYVLTFDYGSNNLCGGTPTSGEQFSGTVTLSDNEQLPFSGTFS